MNFLSFFNQFLQHERKEEENNDLLDIFRKIESKELSKKDNVLFNKIHEDTKEIFLYLDDVIKNQFHLLFPNNLKTFKDSINYLEKIAIPNKCVCAGVIETIPGWRCIECSKYENSIYCSDCYIRSKNQHKDHNVLFLFSSGGMCDCGDPDSVYTYCSEHSGPFIDDKQINYYISKIFPDETLNKLKEFFKEFFFKFSKYLLLTEKFDYFYNDIFNEKFKDEENKELKEEKEDVLLLKNNFYVVFQNLIDFLRLISNKNFGMLHLISNFFLKTSLENTTLEPEYMTSHRCIQFNQKNIQLFTFDNKPHTCICPFFRLFMTNYRDGIKNKENNNEFLLSFSHNLPLRIGFCILFFATYKESLLNNNEDFLSNRNQFYLEDALVLLAEKSNLIEESYTILYDYLLKKFNSPEIKLDNGAMNDQVIDKLSYSVVHLFIDSKYYSKKKVKNLMYGKTSIIERVIDCICLIHNQNEFKSIFPHPVFQNKSFSSTFIDFELRLLKTIEEITLFINWNNIQETKDIFRYIINKILNQQKEGIKQLNEDEYTYHAGLYRCFGMIINSFCFNYSLNNKSTLIESIQFMIKNFFESQEEVEELVDIILKYYFKLFGFIAGGKNNFFNYYDSISSYSNVYFLLKEAYLRDFVLLKYIFIMTKKNIDLIDYFKFSKLENVFSLFEKAFLLTNDKQKEKNESEEEKEKEKENEKEIKDNNSNNSQPSNQDLNNQRIIELLRSTEQTQITPQLLNQFIYNMNIQSLGNEKSRDEYNIIMQWRLLLDMLISWMKDDSCPFWGVIKIYDETVSSQVKRELFSEIRNNNDMMQDLKNILKEKIIHEIVSKGNLIDLQNITKDIDKYLQILFEENNEFNKTLDELTYNKLKGEKKIFYVKDEYLKELDLNYCFSFKAKSGAQKYILDFKKDIIKPYNFYYYKPSKITFEFFETVYKKVLLNRNNLELIIKMLEKLLSEEKITEELDKKSVRNTLLPIILNYLNMFNVINSKAFIMFKTNNIDLINKLNELLSNLLKSNINNKILEKDLEENVKEVQNNLKLYQIIFESIERDLSKLNKYDYNIDFLEKLRQKDENLKEKANLIPKDAKKNDEILVFNIPVNLIPKDENKKKIKNKYKNLMKKKANLFMNKITLNDEMLQTLTGQNKDKENLEDSNNEIMCFFCRNPIKLNSFETKYGKIGLLTEDLFYVNTVKSTVREELLKITNKEINKNDIYKKAVKNIYNDEFSRIISCGHYFHTSCFNEGCAKNENIPNDNNNNHAEDIFTCPLCLKDNNILIPPLNSFIEKYVFLKSEKMEELFEEKIDFNKYKSKEELDLFKEITDSFLKKNNLNIVSNKDYKSFLDFKYSFYKSYFNYLENVFYVSGTTFHKHQQIDTMQNLNLSLRFNIKTNPDFIKQIIDFIKEELTYLAKGPEEEEYIYNHQKYMRYVDSLEKILLSLSILFNYEEIQKTFNYIIYIYIPYFIFGFYFRDLIFRKEFKNINNFQFKEKMNINDFINYTKENNNQLLIYFNYFLKKFCLFKTINDFSNKNQEIINSFDKLNLENLFSFIGMEEFYKSLPKSKNNDIDIMDILYNLKNTFNKNDLFYKYFGEILDHNRVLENIFANIKKNDKEDSITENELIIQFAPIKFNLINLDNNVFDWIEKNLGKECDICHQVSRKSFICLICGDKVCHLEKNSMDILQHTRMCGEKNSLYMNMDNMVISLVNYENRTYRKLYPLYVNKDGTGPQGYEIGREFNLSHEKLNLTIKNFVSNDF